MTIREFLIKNELKAAEERLARLQEMDAPAIMIPAVSKQIEEMRAGKFDVGGDRGLIDLEFTSFEQKRMANGKPYLLFDCGATYFPKAKYGRFIIKTLSK